MQTGTNIVPRFVMSQNSAKKSANNQVITQIVQNKNKTLHIRQNKDKTSNVPSCPVQTMNIPHPVHQIVRCLIRQMLLSPDFQIRDTIRNHIR